MTLNSHTLSPRHIDIYNPCGIVNEDIYITLMYIKGAIKENWIYWAPVQWI